MQYIDTLLHQYSVYFGQSTELDEIIKATKYLFNFEYLIFPRSDVTNKILDLSNFLEILNVLPCVPPSKEEGKELYFEYTVLFDWVYETVKECQESETYFENKTMLKNAVNALKSEIPKLTSFLIKILSIPVSEAICESWGSTIDKYFSKRPNTADGNETTIGTTDKHMFIYTNGPPSNINLLGNL